MSRSMTAAASTENSNDSVHIVHLVKFDFSTPRYFTDFYKDVDFNGDTYSSDGNFLGFEGLEEHYDFIIQDVKILLSGINTNNISDMLTEEYTNKTVSIYRGNINSSFDLVADPVEIFQSGKLKNFSWDENIETNQSNLRWSASSHWADFDRVAGRRTNNSEQQLVSSGDLFFEFTQVIDTDAVTYWGKKP